MTPRTSPSLPGEAPARILLVRLGSLGDLVHVLPALDAVRRTWPAARITWAVDDRWAPLLRDHPQVDAFLLFPRAALRALRGPTRWARGAGLVGAFLRSLRAGAFDLAIDFQGNLRSGLTARVGGRGLRVGYGRGHAREGNTLFTNRRVVPPPTTRHKVDRNLALAAAAGARTEGARAHLHPQPDALARADHIIASTVPGEGPLVLLAPAVSRFGAHKRWDPARFGRVAAALVRDRGARVLLSWGPGEEEVARTVAEAGGGLPRLAPPTPDLSDLVGLIARADLFLSCDSGPLHVAWALGVPTIGLYGPKEPEVYGPLGDRAMALRVPVPCSPCRYHDCPNPICMDVLTEEMVLAACERALGG